MASYGNISGRGGRGGWTLIVLLIAVAIIAVLMAVYLPSVLEVYTPPTIEDKEGRKKSIVPHIRDELKEFEQQHNRQLEEYLPGQDEPEEGKEEEYYENQQ